MGFLLGVVLKEKLYFGGKKLVRLHGKQMHLGCRCHGCPPGFAGLK